MAGAASLDSLDLTPCHPFLLSAHRAPACQYFNDPDTIRPTLAAYSLEKFGKGVRSVCCVRNPETGNTNTLVGGGDGTVGFINQSLNKVRHGGQAGYTRRGARAQRACARRGRRLLQEMPKQNQKSRTTYAQ